MTVKFREVGNSVAVTIPKHIVTQLGLSKGMVANIETQDNIIIVKPSRDNDRPTIKSLFAGYSGDYEPEEIDWGEKKGNEIW